MANKSLFTSSKSRLPRAAERNEAGGAAYGLSPRHALAQLAATGCFNQTFYTNAGQQLDTLRALVAEIDDNVFLAKLAVFARQKALMKDMPAALLATLAKRDPRLMQRVFDRVVDNGRMLRTVFQMRRSGQFGRSGLSHSLQRAFQRWLNEASVEKLLSASIGRDPSLRDVMRMARPTPKDNERRALFGWLTDKPIDRWAPAVETDLPRQIRALAEFRGADNAKQQVEVLRDLRLRWDLLADAARGPEVWRAMVPSMGLQALRMNLNTLARQGVFAADTRDPLVNEVARRLGDAEEIRRAGQFPYQFLSAYLNAGADVPQTIKAALHKGAEIACGNVPALRGPVLIGLDVSGSMGSAITGERGLGATSKMRCVDTAALFAAAVLRRNPDSVIVPFDDHTHDVRIDPADTILSMAERLASFGGGGTNCALPLEAANTTYARRRFAGCILVSDQESWIGAGRHGSTGVLSEWEKFVRNQAALNGGQDAAVRLVCIDMQPYTTTQAPEREDILNVGGFSDAVFEVVAAFLAADSTRFVAEVEAIEL